MSREPDDIDRLIDSLDELPDPLRPDEYSEDESIVYHLDMIEMEGLWDDSPEDESDEDDPRGQTWSTYRIFIHGKSFEDSCHIIWATNDNDDDGYEGLDDSASATYDNFPNVWEALKFTSGGSRFGYGGCAVTVAIDGHVIYTLTEDYQHYRPYCKWPREEER